MIEDVTDTLECQTPAHKAHLEDLKGFSLFLRARVLRNTELLDNNGWEVSIDKLFDTVDEWVQVKSQRTNVKWYITVYPDRKVSIVYETAQFNLEVKYIDPDNPMREEYWEITKVF